MGGLSRSRTGLQLGSAILTVALAACVSSSGPGAVHTLRRGETVYRLARHYDVSVSEIVAANRIGDVSRLPVGARLWIPGARPEDVPHAPLSAHTIGGPGSPARARAPAGKGAPRFEWPLRGRITSRFGWRGRRPHEGVDISGRKGALVRAAAAGRVIYSGRLGEYGNVVIVRHDPRYETVYAHHRRNRVKRGAFVDQGQVVAEVGATGNATGPHLHFEIRQDDQARDPLLFLP